MSNDNIADALLNAKNDDATRLKEAGYPDTLIKTDIPGVYLKVDKNGTPVYVDKNGKPGLTNEE